MRILVRRLAAIAILSVVPAAAWGGNYTWTGGGPEGGVVTSIVPAPWDSDTVLSVVPLSGLFRSIDRGVHWSRVESLSGFRSLSQIVFTAGPSPAVIVGSASGVYRSIDQGETWSHVTVDAVGDEIYYLAAGAGSLWALDLDGSVHESVDGGATWSHRATLPGGIASAFAVDPATGRLYVSTLAGFFWSDSGSSWNSTSHPVCRAIRTVAGQPGNVWIIGYFGVQKSIDGGVTFQPMNQGLGNLDISQLEIPSSPGIPLFAGSYVQGLFKSVDGSSWVPVPLVEAPLQAAISSVSILPGATPRILVALQTTDGQSDNRVLGSEDLGTSWPLKATGFLGGYSMQVAIHPQNPDRVWSLSGASYGERSRLYRTDDHGETWSKKLQASLRVFAVHPEEPDVLYAGGVGDGIWRSENGGETWSLRGEDEVCCITKLALDPQEPDTLYASTHRFYTNEVSLRKSIDGGQNWSVVLPEYTFLLMIDPNNPNVLFAGGLDLKRSTNGGQTWSLVGSFAGMWHGLIDPTDSSKIYLAAVDGAYVSTDGGTSFELFPYSDSPWGLHSFAIDPENPSHLYLTEGTLSPGRIFRSTSSGRTWSVAPATGPSSMVSDLAVRGKELWLATTDGTFHLERSFTDVPSSGVLYPFVDAVAMHGVTAGCGGGAFCPSDPLTRAQASVFILRSWKPGTWSPPPYSGLFADVPADHPMARWIEGLATESIASGCATALFCPEATLTRAQTAVMLLSALHPKPWVPPAPRGTHFADVPRDHYAAAYIEEFARQGYSAGCGGGNFCPEASITRGQMAVFAAAVFRLQ